MYKLFIYKLLIALSLVFLVGCVGTSSDDKSSSDGVTAADTLIFPSGSILVEATNENAQQAMIVLTVLTGDDPTSGGGIASNDTDSSEDTTPAPAPISTPTPASIPIAAISKGFTPAQSINSEENCLGGGTTSTVGNLDENGGIQLTITHENCLENDSKRNGSFSAERSVQGGVTTYYMKFVTDYKVTNTDGSYARIRDNSYFNYQISEGNETDPRKFSIDISSMVSTNNSTETAAETHGIENAEYHYDLTDNGARKFHITQGTIYFNDMKSHIIYDSSHDMSKTPITSDSNGNPISGELRYIMSGSGRLKVVVEDNQYVAYLSQDGGETWTAVN